MPRGTETFYHLSEGSGKWRRVDERHAKSAVLAEIDRLALNEPGGSRLMVVRDGPDWERTASRMNETGLGVACKPPPGVSRQVQLLFDSGRRYTKVSRREGLIEPFNNLNRKGGSARYSTSTGNSSEADSGDGPGRLTGMIISAPNQTRQPLVTGPALRYTFKGGPQLVLHDFSAARVKQLSSIRLDDAQALVSGRTGDSKAFRILRRCPLPYKSHEFVFPRINRSNWQIDSATASWPGIDPSDQTFMVELYTRWDIKKNWITCSSRTCNVQEIQTIMEGFREENREESSLELMRWRRFK